MLDDIKLNLNRIVDEMYEKIIALRKRYFSKKYFYV